MKYKNYELSQKHTVKQIIAARALLFIDNKLLMVSENGNRWHTPGGWIEPLETLHEGCLRELHEETGIDAQMDKVIFASEIIQDELKTHNNFIHKISFYCIVKAEDQSMETLMNIMSDWEDPDNNLIKHRRFIDEDEWMNSSDVLSAPELRALSFDKLNAMTNIYTHFQY